MGVLGRIWAKAKLAGFRGCCGCLPGGLWAAKVGASGVFWEVLDDACLWRYSRFGPVGGLRQFS